MSKSASTPPPDAVHSLTSQIDRIKLSSVNHDDRKSLSSSRSSGGIPASLLPASGAPIHAPTPIQHAVRMEMPVPMIPTHANNQSLTMAYARSYYSPQSSAHATPSVLPQYPVPQTLTPPHPTRLAYSFNSSIPSSVPKVDDTSFPVPSPARPRASSVSIPTGSATTTTSSSSPSSQATRSPSSPSASASASTVQCAGTTKAGKRCTRQVKAPPLLSYFTSADHDPVERLCFQHVKEVLQPTGFYSRKAGVGWIEFTDWIPSYLNADTQAALRVEMERPCSAKDEDGYIYTYEIRDNRTPDEIHLKVGRSTKLVKRLDQWSKQCTSKEVVLRGWWPGTVESSETKDDTSLLKGKIKAGQKGPYCHRLEKLVHLELADLSVHAPYLKPGFLRSKQDIPDTPSGRSSKPAIRTPRPNKPCLDCGAVHKEIFSFKRANKGPLKGVEWEKIVQPVIHKWGRFVVECL